MTKGQKQILLKNESLENIKDIEKLLNQIKKKDSFDFTDFSKLSTCFLILKENF